MRTDQSVRRSRDRRPVRPVLVGLVAALAIGVVLAGCAGAKKTPALLFVTFTPSPTPVPTPTPEVTPSPTPTPPPTPKPTPTTGPCNGSSLTITLTLQNGEAWQTGSGRAMASFELKNTGSTPCLVSSKSQPLLFNGDGSILITGPEAGSAAYLLVQPNGTLRTSIQTGNLCASPPLLAPVHVGFELPGTGLVVVPPPSPSDMGGAPPCSGDSSKPSGDIQMSSWAP